jgi:5-methylcytosine-specific restriction endonuclease McrA
MTAEEKRAKNAAKQRRRRARDPERVRAEDRARYHANPVPKRIASRRAELARMSANPDEFRAASRRARERRLRSNPALERAKLRANDNNHRAREMGAPGVGVLAADILAVERDAYGCCQYCGKPAQLTLDHVEALASGGAHEPDNIVAACASCNKSKGNTSLVVWLAKRAA